MLLILKKYFFSTKQATLRRRSPILLLPLQVVVPVVPVLNTGILTEGEDQYG
jgi:hypothetical protein